MEDIGKITAELQEKYPDVGIGKIEVDNASGKASFYLQPTKKSLAFLENGFTFKTPDKFKERASTLTRDAIDRNVLDLSQKDPYDTDPIELFKLADRSYYTAPLVGSTTNLLASLGCKGFELDIDDDDIKSFYDSWNFDVDFSSVLEWIFLDFFKIGHVTTYKVLAKYEPRVSHLSPVPGKSMKKSNKTTGESAAKKNVWSKGQLPVSYTVLNPQLVTIEGNLLFDKVTTKITLPNELSELLKKPSSEQTKEEKDLIKALPSDLKAAAEKGGEYQLNDAFVGSVTYRKQPYERYAKPRSTRIFDALNYKKSLQQADMSTLDGISNYILKITIGNDEYPVTSQTELESVAQLFNTPSKSFDVVWNHTLQVEKIVSPEIDSILGKGKYEQVNDDITGGLAISRAIIDGVGDLSVAEAGLVVKGIKEEIDYARRQVTRWIYKEYQQIAEAMGFDKFPKVRWDESILKDVILYMNTLATLVDRRMLSYQTALEALGFDYPNELSNMEKEFPLVEEGIFGIIGSPWQQSKMQSVQGAPEGTPSSGRPAGQPAGKKGTDVTKNQQNVQKQTTQKKPPQNQKKAASLTDLVKDMSEEDFIIFKHELSKIRGLE